MRGLFFGLHSPPLLPYNPAMFRLTREVRFAINDLPDDQLAHPPANSYGGYPSLTGLAHFFAARIILNGELELQSQYLVNIKRIDEAVRDALPAVRQLIRDRKSAPAVVTHLFSHLRERWPAQLESLSLALSPFLSLSSAASELPMMRLSQKFEFSASHRLHNPSLSDEENRRIFGKCNNALGHGHNYEVQVTLIGATNADGLLIDIPAFERTVTQTVIDPFDHKHLNTEVPQFRELIPSVENIAKVIYQMLDPKFQNGSSKLHSVTVWETPKTWCEYLE